MGINHRKLDNQGRPLKNPYETTAEAQDRIAKNMAAGTCVTPAAAAEQCGTTQESAPAQTQKSKAGKPICPQCRGFGHIITDVVNGDSEPCPTCNVARWEVDPIADGCAPPPPHWSDHPTIIDAPAAPTGMADKVREAKGLSNDVVVHAPLGCARNLTATEITERKRQAEQKQQKFIDLNPDLKGWVEYVKRSLAEKGN